MLSSIVSKPAVDLDVVQKRRRSTKALYVAMNNGKPISPLCESSNEVLDTMDAKEYEYKIGTYNIQKLHPEVDAELIKKIREKFN